MRSLSSWISRDRNEFGSRDSVVLVVRKQVPPTFSLIHWSFLPWMGYCDDAAAAVADDDDDDEDGPPPPPSRYWPFRLTVAICCTRPDRSSFISGFGIARWWFVVRMFSFDFTVPCERMR